MLARHLSIVAVLVLVVVAPATADNSAAPRITSPAAGATVKLPYAPDQPRFSFTFSAVDGASQYECSFTLKSKSSALRNKQKVAADVHECALPWEMQKKGAWTLSVRALVGETWLESASVVVQLEPTKRPRDPGAGSVAFDPRKKYSHAELDAFAQSRAQDISTACGCHIGVEVDWPSYAAASDKNGVKPEQNVGRAIDALRPAVFCGDATKAATCSKVATIRVAHPAKGQATRPTAHLDGRALVSEASYYGYQISELLQAPLQ